MMFYVMMMAGPLLLSMWASWKVKSAFNKYSKQRVATGLTGAQAAQIMLDRAGIEGVKVVPTSGYLSDHYNPMNKTLALSEAVYSQPTVAAVGVACHEAGHAIQHARNYGPLWLRSALVPMAGIGSNIGYMVMLAGAFMASTNMVLIGAILFSAVLLFQIVTLPVEFDASSRAKKLAFDFGIIGPQDREGVSAVLNAAAMTYVAAAVSTLMTLVYFLVQAGLLGGRD